MEALIPLIYQGWEVQGGPCLCYLYKWLKKDFEGLTAHCLRHTFRGRLRAIEWPMNMIDQIDGWRSVSCIDLGYGQVYSIEQFKKWMELIALFEVLVSPVRG
tara:strand:+ start:803 stop:1108 length:306 start_codon:yes stop_codon:yes gene_type:complete